MTMRVLMVGDVFGEAGRDCVRELVPRLREQEQLDLVICNAENATRGLGLGARHARQVLSWGVDVITLGNHSFRQKDIYPMLNEDHRVVRPANLPRRSPGRGVTYVEVPAVGGDGATPVEVAVVNLMGSLYLDVGEAPFEVAEALVAEARERTPLVFVDMHAEATSEKVAMGQLLKGQATAVVGTHTHVQTSDARILAGATAYITDLGMTGPHDSVIGVRSDIILRRFTTGLGERFEPALGGAQLEGAIVECDPQTGRASAVRAIRVPLEGE